MLLLHVNVQHENTCVGITKTFCIHQTGSRNKIMCFIYRKKEKKKTQNSKKNPKQTGPEAMIWEYFNSPGPCRGLQLGDMVLFSFFWWLAALPASGLLVRWPPLQEASARSSAPVRLPGSRTWSIRRISWIKGLDEWLRATRGHREWTVFLDSINTSVVCNLAYSTQRPICTCTEPILWKMDGWISNKYFFQNTLFPTGLWVDGCRIFTVK